MTNVVEQVDRILKEMEAPDTGWSTSRGEPGEYLVIKGLQIIAVFQACCISCAEKVRRQNYPLSDCIGVLIPPDDAEGECIEETLRRLGE